MSEEKFTKGPWEARLAMSHSHQVRGDNGYASICTMSAWLWSDPREESIANAHLIAAAPELYDACTPLAQILERAVEEGAANLTLIITREMAERILLALSKARGEI